MMRFLFFCLFSISSFAVGLSRYEFKAVSVPEVVELVYSQALHSSFVLDPQVLDDKRLVSFRYDKVDGDFASFWRVFLASLGYSVESRTRSEERRVGKEC